MSNTKTVIASQDKNICQHKIMKKKHRISMVIYIYEHTLTSNVSKKIYSQDIQGLEWHQHRQQSLLRET